MASIDLHAHILPGVDDGPRDLEGSLAFARAAVAAGTVELAATPHVNERRFIAPEDIAPRVAELQRELAQASIPLRLRTGGEIALNRLWDLTDAQLARLGLGGGPYLLLESPFAAHAADFDPVIHETRARGYDVLLAHPERSPGFQRDPGRLRQLVTAGVLVQVTAGALLGDFGERVRQFSLKLLGENLVHVIASDAHDHERRPPGIVEAVLAADRSVPGVALRADWYGRDVPAAILSGAPIPEAPPLPSATGATRLKRRLARALGATAA